MATCPRPWRWHRPALALIRNFRPERAPEGYDLLTLFKQFLSQTGARGKKVGEFESDAHEFEWRVLFVAGMWFQDLFNYDFRRTEMCIIPYGTQMGEISFCAYNTGVGWRNIVEQMMANATVAEWYKQHGRHDVFAKNRPLDIPVFDNPLTSRLPGVPDYVKNLNEDGKLRLRVLG
jgi:uncharacterized radical SAM superfamily Fe-S cluster-containing enzyme